MDRKDSVRQLRRELDTAKSDIRKLVSVIAVIGQSTQCLLKSHATYGADFTFTATMGKFGPNNAVQHIAQYPPSAHNSANLDQLYNTVFGATIWKGLVI